ncbi:MAG: hypothetical protein HYS87_03695 [Candidatus Colwellbacteria bacterium]|nr:hypothetical protein [Candidatus Colwellbacteria bacterium]
MADQPKVKSTPQDFFLHLLLVVTLYASAGAFIALLYQYINILLPDVLEGRYYYGSGTIRFSVATLLIVFPIYIFISVFLNKLYKREPERKTVKVRKWLIGLTLFIASLVIIGDLVALINNFLSGELTLRFLLKVFVILFVAGSIFGYYALDLRKTPNGTLKYERQFTYAIIAVVAVAVLSSFFFIGSPGSERTRRLDDQRVSDLSQIQWQVRDHFIKQGSLPTALNEIRDEFGGNVFIPVDPETVEPYVYEVVDNKSFRLCATFKTATVTEETINTPKPASREFEFSDSNWSHSAGYTCFLRTIDTSALELRN